MSTRPSHRPKDLTTPPSIPSNSSAALLALTQDISALLSISYEATASRVNDWWHSTLGSLGLEEVVQYDVTGGAEGESGKGLAIVIVGAGEATGQSLTLHLAKSGYTVFPFIPLPSSTTPTSTSTNALSHLLLTWSAIRKRLEARNPGHSGAVVPVIVDPENTAALGPVGDLKKDPSKGKDESGEDVGRFRHAGQTVRAYCKDNSLSLAAIICASRKHTKSYPPSPDDHKVLTKQSVHPGLPPTLSPTALSATPEDTLMSLYRTNVLDPLSVIRELSDLLAHQPPIGIAPARKCPGRVIFVNGGSGVGLSSLDDTDVPDGFGSGLGVGVQGAVRMIGAARSAAAGLLREELAGVGIGVCEVVVGPMTPEVGNALRRPAEEGTDPQRERYKTVDYSLQKHDHPIIQHSNPKVASRLTLLQNLWAVDDALLYSSVRRAIEDRYPRYRHHAGLSVIVGDLMDVVPGGGLVGGVGRWILGRVLGCNNQ